jgi:hypothetical protein
MTIAHFRICPDFFSHKNSSRYVEFKDTYRVNQQTDRHRNDQYNAFIIQKA